MICYIIALRYKHLILIVFGLLSPLFACPKINQYSFVHNNLGFTEIFSKS